MTMTQTILTKTTSAVTLSATPSPYALECITPPATEPVTLAEAKAHLRIDSSITNDDNYIAALVTAARQSAEKWLSRALVTQTWRLTLDNEPPAATLELPNPPLISIDHVKSYDENGTPSIFPETSYLADTARQPGRIILRSGVVWPQTNRAANGFEIQYTAGYGASPSDVPAAIRQGILIHTAALYANRGDAYAPDGQLITVATPRDLLPAATVTLFAPYRLLRLG